MSAPLAGMGELIESLRVVLLEQGVEVRTGCRVLGVRRGLVAEGRPGPPGFVVAGEGGEFVADAVVLAVPAPEASRMCRTLDPALAARLADLPVVSSVSVSLGYRAADVEGLPDAPSFLVPTVEGRVLRSCTVASARYPGRAPHGSVLLRVTLREAPDDAAAERAARGELAELFGITADPVVVRVHRWREVMPRYTVGHRQRVALARSCLDRIPGLALAGSAYDGAGLPDCVRSGQKAADDALDLSWAG